MKKWSDEAWELAEPIYREILNLPFVKELAAGTLSRERFLFYIKQDSIYVENYAHVLGHVASRMPMMTQMEDFLRYALDGVAMERILHESYLGQEGRGDAKATPTCLLYNSYETAGRGGSRRDTAMLLGISESRNRYRGVVESRRQSI